MSSETSSSNITIVRQDDTDTEFCSERSPNQVEIQEIKINEFLKIFKKNKLYRSTGQNLRKI